MHWLIWVASVICIIIGLAAIFAFAGAAGRAEHRAEKFKEAEPDG